MEKLTTETMTAIAANIPADKLPSFVLLGLDEENGLSISHFQRISASKAINLLIRAFTSAIDQELEQNPLYSKAYKKIFIDLKSDFNKLILGVNKKVASFNKAKPAGEE